MLKKSFADQVASEMQDRLLENSPLFQDVFSKTASEKCNKCHGSPCKCDMSMASEDENDARKKKKDDEDEKSDSSSSSKDSNKAADGGDKMYPWENPDQNAVKDMNSDEEKEEDKSAADDMAVEAGLTQAFGHLITASDTLDKIGFEKSAELSLSIASFLVEAKKKVQDSKKSKKKKDSKSSGSSSSSKKDSGSKKDEKSSKSKSKK
jgi:hypothetical protein